MMMTLIKEHLALVPETPLLLRGWLALIALEDFPTFSDLTCVRPGLLVQALLYRIRQLSSGLSDHLNEQVGLTYRRLRYDPGNVVESKLGPGVYIV